MDIDNDFVYYYRTLVLILLLRVRGTRTRNKSDFVQYWELGQASKAEIADGKYFKIEGYGTVIGYSKMPNKMVSLRIQNVLYVPEANKWLFLLIAAGQ